MASLNEEEVYSRMFAAFGKLKKELEYVTGINSLIRDQIDEKDIEFGTFEGREEDFINANLAPAVGSPLIKDIKSQQINQVVNISLNNTPEQFGNERIMHVEEMDINNDGDMSQLMNKTD